MVTSLVAKKSVNDNKYKKSSNLIKSDDFTCYTYYSDSLKEWPQGVYNYNTKRNALFVAKGEKDRPLLKSFFNRYKGEYKKELNQIQLSELEYKHSSNKLIIQLNMYYNSKKCLDSELMEYINGKSAFNNLIGSIYQKEVEFRICRIQYPYLDSSILVDYTVKRITTNKKRNLLSSYRKTLKKVLIAHKDRDLFRKKNIVINPSLESLNDFKKNESLNGNLKVNSIVSNTKYKEISGIKLVISGRLNKRRVAARSVSKVGRRGAIKDIYTSHLKAKTASIRGYNQINESLYNLSSKTQNGSFCVQGSISSV